MQTQDVQSVHLQELELQLKIKQLEIEAKDKEEGRKFEMARLQLVHEERMKELEMRSFEMQSQSARSHTSSASPRFDVGKNISLVPNFSEKNILSHFERVATTFEWPKDAWTLLLQCVLTGKAQEVYSSLTLN